MLTESSVKSTFDVNWQKPLQLIVFVRVRGNSKKKLKDRQIRKQDMKYCHLFVIFSIISSLLVIQSACEPADNKGILWNESGSNNQIHKTTRKHRPSPNPGTIGNGR
uniref:Uncharacterized protein n=1 Tax=Ditylenchus dipsaci TaxID=166011 RepID=A0A915CRT7_9BILA